jgi:hypothetical protein
MKKQIAVFAYTIVSAGIAAAQTASPQSVDTRSGRLEFELGVPTTKTVTKLYDEIDYQRACQLYLWALPVVGAHGAGPGRSGKHHWRSPW